MHHREAATLQSDNTTIVCQMIETDRNLVLEPERDHLPQSPMCIIVKWPHCSPATVCQMIEIEMSGILEAKRDWCPQILGAHHHHDKTATLQSRTHSLQVIANHLVAVFLWDGHVT